MPRKYNIAESKVIAAIKKHGSAEKLPSAQKVADELGVPLGAVGGIMWPLEHKAFAELEIKHTPKTLGKKVAHARDELGLRWERIAGRTGLAVSAVKAAYKEETGKDPDKTYVGKGRDFSGVKRAAKPAGTSGRRGGNASKSTADKPATGTSGRRGATKQATKPAAKTGTSGRRGANKAKDPS